MPTDPLDDAPAGDVGVVAADEQARLGVVEGQERVDEVLEPLLLDDAAQEPDVEPAGRPGSRKVGRPGSRAVHGGGIATMPGRIAGHRRLCRP